LHVAGADFVFCCYVYAACCARPGFNASLKKFQGNSRSFAATSKRQVAAQNFEGNLSHRTRAQPVICFGSGEETQVDSELGQGEGCVEPHSGARETTVSMQDRSKPTSENLKRLDAAWRRGCRDEDYATDDEMSTTPTMMMMMMMIIHDDDEDNDDDD